MKMLNMKRLAVLPICAAITSLATPANAGMSDNPPEIGAKIRAMGAKLNRDIIMDTSRLYVPLLTQAPKSGVKVSTDRSYGPHQRNRLDVFHPADKASRAAPIIVFLHGGGFARGDKKLYGNIGTYFARHGLVGLIASYRLVPNAKWPSGAEDIGYMIKWIKANASKYGGDPGKVFLMGHSAGASHVASYVFFEKHQVKNDGVAGAILVSGPAYERGIVRHPGELAYFGADRSKYSSMSSIKNIDGRKIPLFIAYAELDMPVIQRQNKLLIDALYKRDKMLPTVKQVIGHNHISIVWHINTNDESLGADVLEFIRSR